MNVSFILPEGALLAHLSCSQVKGGLQWWAHLRNDRVPYSLGGWGATAQEAIDQAAGNLTQRTIELASAPRAPCIQDLKINLDLSKLKL